MSGLRPEVRCCFHFFFIALVSYIQCLRGGYAWLFEYVVTIVSGMFAKSADCDWWPRLVNPKLWPKRFLTFRALLHLALRAPWAVARDFGMMQIWVPQCSTKSRNQLIWHNSCGGPDQLSWITDQTQAINLVLDASLTALVYRRRALASAATWGTRRRSIFLT